MRPDRQGDVVAATGLKTRSSIRGSSRRPLLRCLHCGCSPTRRPTRRSRLRPRRCPRSSAGSATGTIAGTEGAFVPCAFWLVQALAKTGDTTDATDRFSALVQLATPRSLSEMPGPEPPRTEPHPRARTAHRPGTHDDGAGARAGPSGACALRAVRYWFPLSRRLRALACFRTVPMACPASHRSGGAA